MNYSSVKHGLDNLKNDLSKEVINIYDIESILDFLEFIINELYNSKKISKDYFEELKHSILTLRQKLEDIKNDEIKKELSSNKNQNTSPQPNTSTIKKRTP